MATLSADVQTRYGSQLLISLTNSDEKANASTSVNTTRLDAAADDVEAMFKIHAGVAYDSTDARHVAVAVEGVIALLRARGPLAGEKGTDAFSKWTKTLRDELGRVTGRNRIKPKTTVETTAESERPNGETIRPKFDWRTFEETQLDNQR